MDKKSKNLLTAGVIAAGAVATGTTGAIVAGAAAGTVMHKNIDKIYAAGVRKAFKKNDDRRDRGLTAPDDIVRVTDLAYGPDPEQVMDIYYPVGTTKVLPTIVSVHGGGYVYGDKNLYQYYCMSLAQKGFTVVNFSYRLAPGHKFPAQLEDINSAMRYVCRHAVENYVDLFNVFFVGDSAGAQMASQYCAAVTNPSYAQVLELETPTFALRAAALNCGMYKLDSARDKMIMKCYFDGPEFLYADKMDVLGNITSDYPPCFIMTATGDFLRENAEPFGEFLTQKGVENEVHVYGETDGKLGHVFHCDIRNPYAVRCNEEECEFFRRHIV